MTLVQSDFEHLLALRTGLRQFLRWSEHQARHAGITAGQHQLLLSIQGHPNPAGPTVGEVADYLVLRHHSAVGLIDRAAAAGLVQRHADRSNHGTVRLSLTDAAAEKLEALTETHLEEIEQLAPAMQALWQVLEKGAT